MYNRRLVEALRTRVWNYGKVLVLAAGLAITFFVFAGIAMRNDAGAEPKGSVSH